MQPDDQIMMSLIALARKSHSDGGHAVSAAVIKNGQTIAIGTTTLNLEPDPTAHAEINAIRAAAKVLNSRFLEGCYLYSTYEPCPMCTATAIWAKMQGIVFGANHEDQTEQCPWRVLIPAADVIKSGTPKLELYQNFMREECAKLLHLT